MTRHFRNALAVILLSVTATAGENRYLGAIVVSGSSLNNTTTAAPFIIPSGAKVTVVCSAAVNMLVDNMSTATTGSTKGLPIAANAIFPTSVGRNLTTISGQGTAVIAVIGTATCDVWLRDGSE
jgi:hypothetical protein